MYSRENVVHIHSKLVLFKGIFSLNANHQLMGSNEF